MTAFPASFDEGLNYFKTGNPTTSSLKRLATLIKTSRERCLKIFQLELNFHVAQRAEKRPGLNERFMRSKDQMRSGGANSRHTLCGIYVKIFLYSYSHFNWGRCSTRQRDSATVRYAAKRHKAAALSGKVLIRSEWRSTPAYVVFLCQWAKDMKKVPCSVERAMYCSNASLEV